MSNIDSQFRRKSQASVGKVTYGGRPQSVGIFNADGSTAKMDISQARAERVAANGRAGAGPNPIRLGVGEIMPETAGRPSTPNFTLRGSVPPNQQVVPSNFDPAMKGKTSPLPEPKGPGLGERLKANVGDFKSNIGPKIGDLRSGVTSAFGQSAPTDWKGITKPAASKAKAGLGGALSNMNTATNTMAAGSDLGMIWAAPNADLVEKTGATLEALGNTAGGFLVDRFNQGRGLITGTLTGGVNQATNARPVTQLSRMLSPSGRSGIDTIRDNNFGDEAKHPIVSLGELVMSRNGGGANVPATAAFASPAQAQTAVAPATAEAVPQQRPFTVATTPEAEAQRQYGNTAPVQFGGNGLLAQAEAGFSRARGQYAQGGEGGMKAFRDPSVQAAFNARNMLEGTGIAVNTTKDGRLEFSGDNRSGGGKLYRAADGSMTTDWSKTQNYIDAVKRGDEMIKRVDEKVRGAALSGDRDFAYRLARNDPRLEGIIKQAEMERSLTIDAERGDRDAGKLLVEMEQAKANGGMKQTELALRMHELQGAREDRALNRQLRMDTMRAQADKDAREVTRGAMDTLDKQLEQYATVDGKVDGQKLARLRGLAVNLQPSPGQSPEQFNKEVATLVSLASKLDGFQSWYDKMFTQAGQGGTDLRHWHANEGWGRGGFKTEQGDHMSTSQYNSLTDDEKALLKQFWLKGGK